MARRRSPGKRYSATDRVKKSNIPLGSSGWQFRRKRNALSDSPDKKAELCPVIIAKLAIP